MPAPMLDEVTEVVLTAVPVAVSWRRIEEAAKDVLTERLFLILGRRRIATVIRERKDIFNPRDIFFVNMLRII